MSDRIKMDCIIGLSSCGDAVVLDDIFHHDDSFHGACGITFYAVPKSEYKDSMSRDSIVDSLMSCGMENCDTKSKAIKMYQQMKACGELEDFVYDASYTHMHEALRIAFDWPEKDYPIITCTGGGRMFNLETIADMQSIICDSSVIEEIMQVEDMNKNVLDYLQSLAEEIQADHGIDKPVHAIKAGLYMQLKLQKNMLIEAYVDSIEVEEIEIPVTAVSNDSSFEEEFRSW
jgi:hypothetical protein